MPKADDSSTETLFHHWRRGDTEAGKAMAQRFTDWYYAIAVSRLGEQGGDTAFRAACSKFSKGVVKVNDPRRLLGWAHGIARRQLHAQVEGGRLPDGDFPNAFTKRQSPKDLLVRARKALPDDMGLIEAAYRGEAGSQDPQRLLRARYAVKAWLRDHAKVPFRITPTDPDPDRAPLPFYEAGQMNDESEEVHFELYMLNEQEVCQDVAEFAHYAIALRGGLPGPRRAPAPRSTPEARPAAPPVDAPPADASASTSPARTAPSQAAPNPSGTNWPFLLAAAVVLGLVIAGLLSLLPS